MGAEMSRIAQGHRGHGDGGELVVGGVSWTAACFVHNSLPQGCIDEGCADRAMRGSSPVATTLFVVAGLCSPSAGSDFSFSLDSARRSAGSPCSQPQPADWDFCCLAAAGVVSTWVDNEWNGMPGLVVPGILLLAVGLVLVATVIIRRRVVPIWTAALLLGSALLLPFANEQTSRILLAVPFGLAWILFGLCLVVGRSHFLSRSRGADSLRDRYPHTTVGPWSSRTSKRHDSRSATNISVRSESGRRRRLAACTTWRCISSDVEQTITFYQDAARVPADRAVREPRLPGLDALLLRHRQRQPARLLRLPRPRPRPVRRGARRPAPHRDLASTRSAGSTCGESSSDAGVEHEVHRGVVALLQRPRRRAPRADLRPARRDVRHQVL